MMGDTLVTAAVHLPYPDSDGAPVKISSTRVNEDGWTLDLGVHCTIFVHTVDQARALAAACSKMAVGMVNDLPDDESVRLVR